MEWPFRFHKEMGALVPRPRATVRRRIALTVALTAGIALAAWAVTGILSTKKHDDGKSVPVTDVIAAAKAMPVQISTIGHVEPIATVAVRPRVEGQIASVAINEGQSVKTGDVLFQLDDRQARAALDQAVASLQRDQAQLEYARKEVERQRALAKNDFVSRSQLDQANATADALVGTVASDQAQIANMQAALSFTTITAPIDGRVGSISVKMGNTVETGSSVAPLVTINQIAPIYVSFSVPQGSLSALREAFADGPVEVSAQPTGDDKQPSTGSIAFYENTIDAATGTLGVRATFPNADERLWPGQFVQVVITLRVEQNAVTVPAQAVQMGQNGSYIFVIGEDDTVTLRNVTVSRTVNGESVVTSGLKAGERVVTSGQIRLVPGAKIRRVEQGQGAAS